MTSKKGRTIHSKAEDAREIGNFIESLNLLDQELKLQKLTNIRKKKKLSQNLSL